MAHIEDVESLPVGFYFGDHLVRDVELHMVAVGTHDRLRKSDRRVAPRPMKCRLEDHLFRGIALRLVETSRRFGLAEHVGHTVIADAIAGAKISVRVVVEGAPANASGILRI